MVAFRFHIWLQHLSYQHFSLSICGYQFHQTCVHSKHSNWTNHDPKRSCAPSWMCHRSDRMNGSCRDSDSPLDRISELCNSTYEDRYAGYILGIKTYLHVISSLYEIDLIFGNKDVVRPVPGTYGTFGLDEPYVCVFTTLRTRTWTCSTYNCSCSLRAAHLLMVAKHQQCIERHHNDNWLCMPLNYWTCRILLEAL